MATEINVPVRLQIQNLQSLVTELQNKLGNLKVGSAGFKSVQNTIKSIRDEIDKLSIQTSKPFMDASQFTKAEHSVDKLEEQIDKVSLTISRLKFSDLELSPQQKSDIKAFEDQINSIKDKLKVVKNTAKDDFLNSQLGQQWLKIDDTAFSKSLSQITNNIRHAVAEQNAELNKLEQTALSYQKAIEDSQRIRAFFDKNGNNPLADSTSSIATLGQELYDKIFTTTTSGKWQFKSGGKNLLSQWLESELKLDQSTIETIINKNISASQVGAKLKEALNTQLQLNQKTIDNNPNITAQIDAATVKYNELISILKQVGLSEEQVAAAEGVLRGALNSVSGEAENYKDKLVEAARSNTSLQDTSNAMKSQLDSLRTTLQQTNGEFIRMQRTQQSFNQMKMAVVNFMGFNQVLNLTRNAIRNAINHIRELDTVMNKISIVTDMSTGDLWNQVDAYSKMAQTYGVSIKGAYEVSQIYYQQGLQTNDVLTLTNETLKLAKISGLDYATTTDYMTTAIRGFKMEMSEASRVVDVYSNLAAHTAVSQEELAVAMSKTASSMEAVGATFEEASAMIGTMVAVTRESATNIGSAMKSIASRYGELTKDPTKLVDEEGEAMAFNKVDAALQSVGISMRTVDGQFREFTDVIVELGEKWDQLDSVQQRYIATQFAGNRQQSRFLALVSNVDLLKSNLDVAMNSEDTGTLQALKALDSIEAKTEQVRVAYQQFYTTIGAENIWKGFLDSAKNVINTLNSFPKAFGKIPLGAIGALTSVIGLIKSIGIHLISGFAEIFGNGLLQGMSQAQTAATQGATTLWERIKGVFQEKQSEAESLGRALGESTAKGYSQNSTITAPLNLRQGLQDKFNNNSKIIDYYQTQVKGFAITDQDALTEAYQILGFNMQRAGMVSDELREKLTSTPQQAQPLLEEYINSLIKGNNSLQHLSKSSTIWSNSLQSLGSALNTIALTIDTTAEGGKTLSGTIMSISGVMSLASAAIKGFSSGLKAIPWVAVASGAIALINGISTLIVTSEERLEELTKKAEDLSNKAKESKAEYRTLDNSIKKIKELEMARYDSAEAAEEYQTAVENLAEEFPILIRGFDEAGNAILDASAMEGELTEARQKAAEAAYAAAQAEAERAKQELANKKSNISSSIGKVRNLIPGGTRQTVLAQYQTENGSWQNIGAYGGQNQYLYEKLSNSNITDLTLTQQRLLAWLQQNDEQNRYDGMALARLLDESTAAASQGDYNRAAELNDMFNMAIQTMNWRMVPSVKSTITDFNNLMAEVTPLQSQIDIANKQSINAWLRSSEYYKLPFIQQNSKLSTIAENQIYKLANGNYSKANLELTGQEVLSQANLFWATLSDDMQDKFNTIFGNPENYTKNDITSIIQDNYISESIIPDWLFNIFDTQTENIRKTLQGKLDLVFDNKDIEQYTLLANMIQDENKQFTLSEQKFLIEILSQIQDLNLHGFDSSFLSDSAIGLIDEMQNIVPEVRKTLFDQIILNGFTAEGLQKTLDYISNNNIEIDTSYIELIATHIIPNISLSTQAVLSNFKEQWEDINKLFSSLSSGVEQKDIEGIIQEASQYGINLSETDFQAYGDKFIVESNAINAYLNDMYAYYVTSFTNIKESLEIAYDNLTLSTETIDDLTGDITSSDDIYSHIDDLRLILQEDFNKWFTQDEDSLEYILNESKTEEELWIAIQEKYEEGKVEIDKLTNFFSNIITNLKKTTAWQQGDYSSLLDTTAFNNLQGDALAYEKLTARLYQLADLNTEWSAAELYEPDVKNAVLNIRKAYSSLLSDILNKGFENIDLSDYEGLSGISEDLLTGTYQKFIQTYISRTGLMIDEANNLLLQAIQKDRETKSIDLIKNLQFVNKTQFKTDSSSLTELANKIDTPLTDILRDAVISYNEVLDEYIVDATKIDNLDLSSTEFQNTIQNSIEEFFKSLSSYISNALKGSLGSDNARDLQEFATNRGIGKLNFTQTADGLKLANDSARKVVAEVEKLDSLQGQVLFEELMESLIKSEDAFKSISSTTAYIKDLEEELAQLRDQEETPDNDKRIKALEQELDLAKKINAIRATTEDDTFKFMDQKIPSGQNNPLNYWKNWTEAFEKMKATTSGTDKGLMAYEDFYNIVTEMGHIAEASGTAIHLGNETLSNSEDAANLIERAAATLSNMSTGDMGVTLGKFGIDFSSGVEGMAENVDAGIDAIAEEQIKMLDSMIQLLETVVAMEELGKIDVDNDNILDLGEIFEVEYDPSDPERILKVLDSYNVNFQTVASTILKNAEGNDDLTKALDQMKITSNGVTVTMREMFEDAQDGIKDISLDYYAYQNILQSFYNAYLSGDYDLDNLFKSIQSVFANTGFEGEIQLGDQTLIVSHGTTIIKTKDGDYVTSKGTTCNSIEEAVARETVENAGINKDSITYNQEIGIAEGILELSGTNFTITGDTEGNVTYTDAQGISGSSLQDYIHNRAEYEVHRGEHATVEEIEAQLAIKYNLTPLDSFTYQSLNTEIKQKLEEALASGKQTEVDTVIKANPVLSSLSGKTGSEIAQQLGIKLEDQNLSINVTGADEAEAALQKVLDVFEQLTDKNITITVTDETAETLATLQTNLNDPNAEPVIKEVKARITEYINGEGENADPNKLVSNLQGILTTYETQIPEDQKKAIEGLIGVISQATTAPDMTLPEIKDLVMDLTIGKNEPKEIIESNQQEAAKGLIQTIKAENKEVPQTLQNNQNLASNYNVQQKITVTTEYVTKGTPQPRVGGGNAGGGTGGGQFLSALGLDDGTRLTRPRATGNVALAKGTLMGELGPELVVQNGHYFVAGQNGAEFVDLMDDAIVFNHLQTQQLLKNGMSNSRGQALTNERVATAYAQGNVNGGPAMASASAALNALKQLRAQWQALAGLSAKDLAGKGGGGGGGGGSKDMGAFLKDLERWYNWLQRIEQLEKEINYQEQLRAKIESDMIPHGQDYFNSQLVTLGKLEDQVAIRQDLLNSQQEYFNQRRAELNTNSPFSSLYTFDETGQLKYREGAFSTLSEILSSDAYGKPKYTPEEQYKKIVALNPNFANYMKYDNEGKEIKWTDDQGKPNVEAYTTALEAFWDKIDTDKEEMQSLHDSIEDLKVDILENYESMNEILHDIEENQIDVENKVLAAIEDSRQREIDGLQDTRDAIEESNNKLIQGLQDQLDNERQMYETQANSEDLTKLQRQLAILQRSGASSSDISNLQTQITDKQYDMYFESQEKQIDAIQQASDAQLERLDAQIDLMTETLAYEKENGLLWEEVYEHMVDKTPEEIAQFIRDNDSSLWGESPTEQIKTDRENLFKLQQWAEMNSQNLNGIQTLVEYFTKTEVGTENLDTEAKKEADVINGLATKNASADAQAKAAAALPATTASTIQKQNNATNTTNAKSTPTKSKGYKVTYTVIGDGDNGKPITHNGYGIGRSTKAAENAAKQLAAKAAAKLSNPRFVWGKPVEYQYEHGGMVKEDGEGYLHANEGVLTPEQTSTLRNEILGNKPNSLLSLLMTWRDSVMGLADTSSISNYDSGINIEKAEVIMQVSQIANDYDAQRAGEQALDKIMSIARKTMAQNRIGR